MQQETGEDIGNGRERPVLNVQIDREAEALSPSDFLRSVIGPIEYRFIVCSKNKARFCIKCNLASFEKHPYDALFLAPFSTRERGHARIVSRVDIHLTSTEKKLDHGLVSIPGGVR